MIRAAFFDLDGTLLNTSGVSTPAVHEALAALRARGIRTFVSTGRSPYEINTNHMLEGMEFDAIVSMNGQYCYSGSHVIHKRLFDQEDLLRLLELQAQTTLPCAFVEQDDMYLNFIDHRVLEAQSDFHTLPPPVQDISHILEREILMVSVYLTQEQEAQVLAPNLRNSVFYRWNPSAVDIMPKGVSKQTGIDAVLAAYGLDRASVIAFGDGGNDIEMLECAGIGVAMGNCIPELLHRGLYVTGHVDNDGVVTALEHFGLL